MTNATQQTRDAMPSNLKVKITEGWISASLVSGVKPNYGYPKNHLPMVRPDFQLNIASGYSSSK